MRHKHSLEWVMNLVQQVSLVFDYPKQRVNFLYAIIDMFKEMIMDITEFGECAVLFREYVRNIFKYDDNLSMYQKYMQILARF